MKLVRKNTNSPKRVFYAAGPGDAVHAHKNWKLGVHDPTEVSITFSSQIEQYCYDVGASLYIVCYHNRAEVLRDGATIVENLPKPYRNARGLNYHLRELAYGLMLLKRAIRFRADVAILDSGCTHYFWQRLFSLFGIRVVPVLHNSLWPNGFMPNGVVARAIRLLDRGFWRRTPLATLCVSPLCARQIEQIAGHKHPPVHQIRAQFDPQYFSRIPPPPPPERRPFTIMFVGRVVAAKGVFDILEIAGIIEAELPGQVRWIVCGTGDDFDELKRRRDAMGLSSIVELRGWTSLDELARVYAESHCSIVPTTSDFIEGLAMTAAEAALAGRPVITNPVVPALEILAPAAVAYRTNDPTSAAEQIMKLIDDPKWYRRMAASCSEVAQPFVDRRQGLTAVLKEVLGA